MYARIYLYTFLYTQIYIYIYRSGLGRHLMPQDRAANDTHVPKLIHCTPRLRSGTICQNFRPIVILFNKLRFVWKLRSEQTSVDLYKFSVVHCAPRLRQGTISQKSAQ